MPPPEKLPLEILTDVLLRLPPRSLLRVRSVSKPLRALIDSDFFAAAHLRRTLATAAHRSLILRDWFVFVAHFDSSLAVAAEIRHTLNKVVGGSEVFGSSNGLLAVCNSDSDLALWNPSVGVYRQLPEPPLEPAAGDAFDGVGALRHTFFGLGHEPAADDYKVVRMVLFRSEDGEFFSARVRVFSLRANAWVEVKEVPSYARSLFAPYYYLLYRRSYGTCAGGALHWVAPSVFEARRPMIVSFDLRSEKFGRLSQPESYPDGNNFHLDLGVLDGCLCMSCNYFNDGFVDIWVMKEYGVKETWNNLFRISESAVKGISGYVMPLAYCESGVKVLLEVDNRKLVWYDWKRRKTKRVKMEGAPRSFSAVPYVGSLLLLKDGDAIHGRKVLAKEESNKKNDGKKRDDFLSQGFRLIL